MTTITKERLEQLASGTAWVCVQDDEATELARIALASLEEEPVAYIIQDKYERDRGTDGHLSRSHASKYVSPEDINEHEIICTALFKAPPLAYSVPDEWTFQNTQRYREDTGRQDAWSAMWGWNACRAAMQGKAESQDRLAFDNQVLSDLYHAQEKRLFKIAQRIKGPAFDKYAYSPSQAIDVLEAAIFGDSKVDHASMIAAAPQQEVK